MTVEADFDGDGVFEAMGGDEVVVPSRRVSSRARLRVRAQRATGTTVTVYAAPGRSAGPLATFAPATDDETYLLPLALASDQVWYRVEVRSPGALPLVDSDPTLPDQLRAASSPVFVSVRAAAEPMPEIQLPAPVAGADHAGLMFGPAGGFTGFADVAVAAGVAHVVAESHADGATSIVYRRDEAHGHGGDAVELSDGSATARAPRIAASGHDVWVVWSDERGHEQPHLPAIYLRHSRNARRGGRSRRHDRCDLGKQGAAEFRGEPEPAVEPVDRRRCDVVTIRARRARTGGDESAAPAQPRRRRGRPGGVV